ncbi:MAG TPA: MaoC family dehydratase N-terminal domain-containing protein [Solirubrobacterales bacterium]|nr:MaoC family dehydratase N-terminal domain-containing protein [Solirubrobacterales bacterium]
MKAQTMAVPPLAWGPASAWIRPFDELEVGDSYVSKRRTVTETDIVKFAQLGAEMSPRHGDPVRFGPHASGGLRAPALLALTYSIGLVPNDFVRALRRILEFEPGEPVRPGDTIHVEAEIVRLEEWTEEYGLVAGRWRIVNQDDALVASVELEAVWIR